MSKQQYTAEEAVDNFLKDLNDEIENEEYEFIESDSEENSPLILLPEVGLEREEVSDTEDNQTLSVIQKNASKRSKKLVNNLNAALNSSNYDDISNVTVRKIYTACLGKQKLSNKINQLN